MTIPELINNLGQPEWVALHLFGAIEALDFHLGLTPKLKRWAAFLGALGAPILGYILKTSTTTQPFDLNALLVTAGGAWVLATQVMHKVWERLEDKAVLRAVQITTVLPPAPPDDLPTLKSQAVKVPTPPPSVTPHQ